MAWLATGLAAIVVCDHGTVKRAGVRTGAGAATSPRRRAPNPSSPRVGPPPCPRGSCNLLEVGMRDRRPPLKPEPQQCRSYTVTPKSSNASNAQDQPRPEAAGCILKL